MRADKKDLYFRGDFDNFSYDNLKYSYNLSLIYYNFGYYNANYIIQNGIVLQIIIAHILAFLLQMQHFSLIYEQFRFMEERKTL